MERETGVGGEIEVGGGIRRRVMKEDDNEEEEGDIVFDAGFWILLRSRSMVLNG